LRIKILNSALEDLYKGRLFYEEHNSGLGEYFFNSLFSDIDSLTLFAGVHIKVSAINKKTFLPYVVSLNTQQMFEEYLICCFMNLKN